MDSLSPSVRSGNVLALLNTLYTSGFAMASPSTPVLAGRTMHTLYALSFVVYVTSSVADWLHVWAVLRGKVASFVVETWLALALVTITVAGSMLTWLLLVLCVENAFAHRLDVTPYRSGFALIAEAVVEWFQAFNNFRVCFLQMALHDAPMTLINFFFLASCRCAGPNVIPWTLLFSASCAVASSLWRFTMLYFAYSRMLCPMRKTSATASIHRMPTVKEHLQYAIDISEGGRLDEYDECWPVRWARSRIYGTGKQTPRTPTSYPGILSLPGISHLASAAIWAFRAVLKACRFVICSFLSFTGYLFLLATCCVPYCRHYTCRKNSFYHRHKCARSFIKYFSTIFHYSVFIFSVLTCLSIFALNILLISSVHVIGSNNVPPEIDRVCITVLPASHTVHASIIPLRFWTFTPLAEQVNSVCKPIWEDGGLGIGLKRRTAGPWQTRRRIQGRLLAVATQAIVDNSDTSDSGIIVWFDVAEFPNENHALCNRGDAILWKFIPDETQLNWPYFYGCRRKIIFLPRRLIDCSHELTTPPTTPAQGWRRRQHRPRRPHRIRI